MRCFTNPLVVLWFLEGVGGGGGGGGGGLAHLQMFLNINRGNTTHNNLRF